MPQFQIRRHPYGGTFQTFFLNSGKPTSAWFEANSVQECLNQIDCYIAQNVYHLMGHRFRLEVFPD